MMHETPDLILPDYDEEVRLLLLEYTLQLADTSLILGHRLSEWCGHGPVLEQDLALTNIALDLIGETRGLYQYAAALEGQGRTEDDLAYLRQAVEYRNPLLVELPNGDFGDTVMRQFLFDNFHYHLLAQLQAGRDPQLAAVAAKSVKEAAYHLRWSSEWVIRLGDGTAESKRRMLKALADQWRYTGEFFQLTPVERALSDRGLLPDYNLIKTQWEARVDAVFAEATLEVPQQVFMQQGGKLGRHTEYLGYILAELQYLQRAYPGCQW